MPKKLLNAWAACSSHLYCLRPPEPRPWYMRLPSTPVQALAWHSAPRSGANGGGATRAGGAGNALLRDRGNKSLRRRLSEYAPSRGSHESATLIVWGATQGPGSHPGITFLVVKPAGREVSDLEKNSDVYTIKYTRYIDTKRLDLSRQRDTHFFAAVSVSSRITR